MSIYSIGDIVDIQDVRAQKKIKAVVTNIKNMDGYVCYYIRRQDNKTFYSPVGPQYNSWIRGEKIEVSSDETG